MSTTLFLCENNWIQRCIDCDFYPCVHSTEDSSSPNDCDEFTHSDTESEYD